MAKTAATRRSDWRNGFLFLGNQLALDFLNTRPLQNGAHVELLPDFRALLRWFRAAGLLGSRDAARLGQRWGRSARAQGTLEPMRRLREAIRRAVLRREGGGNASPAIKNELNRLMAMYPMRTRLKVSAGVSSSELWFPARQPEDLFAPLAHSATDLLANLDRSRVRQCRQCVLHFYDTSKKGTRRWCSMRLCGNRLKVAAYAARRRNNSV
jgi:predicted RNA-binding Zn ribbon-like protein